MTTTIRIFTAMAGLAVLTATAPVMAQSKGKTGSDGRRAFYLTKAEVQGDQPTMACAPGFHMASLTEILNPTNLRYEHTLGETGETFNLDRGSGAPHGFRGWIRTGQPSNISTIPGEAQCSDGFPTENWHSNSNERRGTVVFLPGNWSASATFSPIGPWVAEAWHCNLSSRVWCVQD